MVRSTLVVVIYEKGFKDAVPRWQKNGYLHNTTHQPTNIARCERVWVCGCVGGGGVGGKGRSGTARS